MSGRLLLRHAMQRAQAQDKVCACDSHHLACRKQVGQFVQGHTIVGIVESRHQHNLVRDVEVCVARRQTLPVEINRFGHWECFYPERSAVLITHLFQQREILLKRLIVRFRRILFGCDHNRIGIRKASQVVNMAVRIIACDPVSQPECMPCAEESAKHLFNIFPGEPWISLLNRAQQALLRGQDGSASIDIDASTLEHDPPISEIRRPTLQPKPLPNKIGHSVVFAPVVVLRPSVEVPVENGRRPVRPFDENRAVIASPTAICGASRQIQRRSDRHCFS